VESNILAVAIVLGLNLIFQNLPFIAEKAHSNWHFKKFCEATPAPGVHELCEEARRIE